MQNLYKTGGGGALAGAGSGAEGEEKEEVAHTSQLLLHVTFTFIVPQSLFVLALRFYSCFIIDYKH